MNPFTKHSAFVVLALSTLLVIPAHAGKKNALANHPDFTKGVSIPEGATHDWTLGATGARGWMYFEKTSTADARQIYITEVAKGSPADGVLKVGDVILGVAGKPFSYDPRTEFGKALTVAESEAGGGKLALSVWRSGKQGDILVKLPVLGTYSATAPYGCPKSKRILEQGCEALAKRIQDPSYKDNPISRSLNSLALLASGDPKYLPIVKKEAKWASDFSAETMATWYYGYVIMLLAEYQLATGDDEFMPGLRRLALEASNGQSVVGSWGHKFAGPDGRLVGYGMMNAPGIPMTTSLVMARAAGIKDPEVELAIKRSTTLLSFYIEKGSIPYGDHAPWMDSHDSNGKNSMAAVLFNLLDDGRGARYFSRMSLAAHGAERDAGHSGNFWNITWAMPGVSQSGPQATGAWMKEFGAWYFDLARNWDGTFIHQGPPALTDDHTPDWDATGADLLAYAMPLKKICLTGKLPNKGKPLDAAEARQVINDGRGWASKESDNTYYQSNEEVLLKLLSSWSPTVRERAAKALARHENVSVPSLIKLLESPQLESRLGACQALAKLKEKAAPAVPVLRKTLKAEDFWLRINAAEALAAIGQPAMVALPELLTIINKGPSAEDPRGIEQRFVSTAVFKDMLGNSVDGVDRNALNKAILAGLRNQHGDSRGAISNAYDQLTYDEIKPLLPAIYESIVNPALTGGYDLSLTRGVQILAKHHIREGIPLCVSILEPQRHGAYARVPRSLEALATYGTAAKPMLPKLREIEKECQSSSKTNSPSANGALIREYIEKIENSSDSPSLRSLK